MSDQFRAERVNQLARASQLSAEVAGMLYDVLPKLSDAAWDHALRLIETDVAIGTAITRSRCTAIWRTAVTATDAPPPSAGVDDEFEVDVEYAKDRLMLIEMVLRGDIHPEVVAPRLLTLAEKHPHLRPVLEREAEVYRRHPQDWRGAMDEFVGGDRRG